MKKTRIVGLLLVFVLVTSCFVGGTFAKYASQASGSDTATVAKWSIIVNNKQIAVDPKLTDVKFDLFATINEEDTTNAETDVATGAIIAPGTGGKFNLVIENFSDVTAEYTITLSHVNPNNIPIEYSVDGDTWTYDISTLKITSTDNDTDNNPLTLKTGKATETVYWRWQFNDVAGLKNDDTDTNLGIAARDAAQSITVTATIYAEQVD